MRTLSDLSHWSEPPRWELSEIMDELEPGWAAWQADEDFVTVE